ncbi:MAG TPA: hypothetical protein VGU01_11230 [Sphingomicrobium sp.]|nr:hypothetical protein [Sphingomicrobium sp.]
MKDLSIGAVVAALIAALVSLLGLVIGKEQKTSEFRQAWIDALRAEFVSYTSSLNLISDKLRARYPSTTAKVAELTGAYEQLNRASFAIKLRLNPKEQATTDLLSAMSDFEALAQDDTNFTPSNIRPLQDKFTSTSQELLKNEWDRVKKGEPTFRVAKRGSFIALVVILVVFVARLASAYLPPRQPPNAVLLTRTEAQHAEVCVRDWASRLASAPESASMVADEIVFACAKPISAKLATEPQNPGASYDPKKDALLSVLQVRAEKD